MKKRTKLFLVLDIALVLALALGIYIAQERADERERRSISQEDLDRRFSETISYQGNEYPLKRGLTTVLLIGTDNYVDDEKQFDFESFYNRNLADFLVLLAFDHNSRTVTPFQINRDTMCDVPWLSVNGLVGGTERLQITFAHTFGSGKEDSCVNTCNAVKNLLYGLPIDNYLAFSMDTVPVVNDLVGGVTVKLEDDIPQLGPEYVRGANVTLKGNAALRFVRYRDTSLLDDNLRRMSHHRQYLEAFTAAAREAAANDPDLISKGYRAVEKFLCTDLSVEQFTDLINELTNYELRPTVCADGKYVPADPFPEFLVDDASQWAGIRSTFCK